MVEIVVVSPRASIVGVPATSGKMGVEGMEGGNGIVMEVLHEDGM